MVKPARGMDPLLRRPFSVFEVLRGRRRAIHRHHAPQQTHRRRHRPALRRRARALASTCLGPLGRPFEPIESAGASVDGRRRRRPGAVRDAGRGAARAAARRRRSSTAPGAPPSCTTSTSSSALGVSSSSLSTEDGSRGRARPRHRAARARARSTRPGDDVHDLRLRPDADAARRRDASPHAHGRACDVSVEHVMGCGLGGCYSCVVPMRGDGRHAALRALVPRRTRVFDADEIVWEAQQHGSVRSDRLADAEEPAHRRERLLRLRRRVRATSSICRRSAASPSRDCSSPSAKAIRRRASSRRRRACSTRSACRASASTASSHEKLPELRARRAIVLREHLRHDDRRVRRAGAHPVGRRGRGGARAEHLVPQHQGRRHHVRLQPRRHARRRQRRPQGDARCRSFPS